MRIDEQIERTKQELAKATDQARQEVHAALRRTDVTTARERVRQVSDQLRAQHLEKREADLDAARDRAHGHQGELATLTGQINELELQLIGLREQQSAVQRKRDAALASIESLTPRPRKHVSVHLTTADPLVPPADLSLIAASAWQLFIADASSKNARTADLIVNELSGDIVETKLNVSSFENGQLEVRRAAATLRVEQSRGR